MKADLILIANASQARLLSYERGSPMVILESFEHPQSRSRIRELVDDKMGQEASDRSFGGSAYQPRMDAKQKESTRFARELADRLEQLAQQGGFHALAVFASSPFLGELKAELGAGTARLLSATHDLDLTHFGLTELEERVMHELRPAVP